MTKKDGCPVNTKKVGNKCIPLLRSGKNHLIYMGKYDTVELFFEGHTFQVEYDTKTNENLKMKKVI